MELDSPNSSPSHSPVARAAGTPPSFSSVASMPTLSRGSSTASTGNFPRSPSHQPEVDNFPPRPSDTTPVAPKQPSTIVADNHVEPTPPHPLKRKVVIPNPFVSGGLREHFGTANATCHAHSRGEEDRKNLVRQFLAGATPSPANLHG